MEVTISEWGNSLGLRIPKDIAQELKLTKGSQVDIQIKDGVGVFSAKKKPKYTIEELMADTTPETYRNALDPEFRAYWQTDVGREIIDE